MMVFFLFEDAAVAAVVAAGSTAGASSNAAAAGSTAGASCGAAGSTAGASSGAAAAAGSTAGASSGAAAAAGAIVLELLLLQHDGPGSIEDLRLYVVLFITFLFHHLLCFPKMAEHLPQMATISGLIEP